MEQEYETQEIPGLLKTLISLDLNTKQAVSLFYGQEGDKEEGRPEITGLVKFADKLKQITYAAHVDDPYADYYLIKIEAALIEARKKIKAVHTEVTQYSDRTLLTINQGSSIKPVKLKTSFSSVYANMSLELLKYSDNIMMEILAIKHIGLIGTTEANAIIGTIKRVMRHVFLSSKNYRYTQVTRKDVRNKTAKYQTAHNLMKFTQELPQDLLEKVEGSRAKNAPNVFDPSSLSRAGPTRRRKVAPKDKEVAGD